MEFDVSTSAGGKKGEHKQDSMQSHLYINKAREVWLKGYNILPDRIPTPGEARLILLLFMQASIRVHQVPPAQKEAAYVHNP